MKNLPRIIVIVGPTASGKTGLAVRLARKYGGEVVSADSRLLYKGMDIGTAKPTKKEMGGVPHHLIDVVSPAKTLTLAEYKKLALKAIDGILKRGKLPIVVGGTGLYVQALVDNLKIPEVPPNMKLRAKLSKLPHTEQLRRLRKADPAYAARAGHNPRYIIRALEVIAATGKSFSSQQGKGEPLFAALQVGLRPARSTLETRISKRIEAMIRRGLIKEVRRLAKRHSETAPALSGIGYRELLPFLNGEIERADALEAIKLHTKQYAKRQMTWFKRDHRIRWFSTPEAAAKQVEKWLK